MADGISGFFAFSSLASAAATLINGEWNREHQEKENRLNREHQAEMARLQDEMQKARDAKNFERQIELKMLEQRNQFELNEQNFQRQQELARERQNFERELCAARFEYETAAWETNKFDEIWPLRLTPRAYQAANVREVNGRVPLQILVGADLAPQGVADGAAFDASLQNEFTANDAIFRNGAETLYYTNGWKEGKIYREGTAPFQLLFSVLKIPTLALTVARSTDGDYELLGAFWNGIEKLAAPPFVTFAKFNAHEVALELARVEGRENLERGLPDKAFTKEQQENMQAWRKEKEWREQMKYDEATPETRAFLDKNAKRMFIEDYRINELNPKLREIGKKTVYVAIATAVDCYRVACLGEEPRVPAFLASKKDDPLYPSVASVAEGYRALLNPESANWEGPEAFGLPRRLAATAKAFYDVGEPDEAERFQRAAWDVLRKFYGEPYQTQATEHLEAIETLKSLPKQLGDEKKTMLLIKDNSPEIQGITRLFRTVEKAGEGLILTIGGIEYTFLFCPPGSFFMGSPEDEEGRWRNETQREVTLTRGFYLLQTPVTQAMWENVMGSNPSYFSSTGGGADKVRRYDEIPSVEALFARKLEELKKEEKGGESLNAETFARFLRWRCERYAVSLGGDTSNFPVESVSWNDCQEFIAKLNDGGYVPLGFKFRLPWEAEWEFAARAGTTTSYFWGTTIDRDKANYDWYLKRTTKVGSYPTNPWGFRDMSGNVLEWCGDWYAKYDTAPQTDPTGPSSGSRRVLRGGSWINVAENCRSARRLFNDPARRHDCYGFRLVLGR